MKIPVLAVVGRQESLVASVIAVAQRNRPSIRLTQTKLPRRLRVDPLLPAVPLGSAGSPLEMSAPAESDDFVIRAVVDAESPDAVPHEIDGVRLFADPQIRPFLTCGGSRPLGTDATVKALLNVPGLTARGRGMDGQDVAIAIMDTGINLPHLASKLGVMPLLDAGNSLALRGLTMVPGAHPVSHGTMCAYDALIAAPRATLLDFPILRSAAPGGSGMAGTLGFALQAYSQLLTSWAVTFGTSGLSRYKGLVVSNSWGMYHPSWDFPAGHPGRYCDNPSHPFNIVVGALARSNADIVFAAGNCGGKCADTRCRGRVTDTIMGANALQDVLTLGGCDTKDHWVGYSSQGPAIAGMFPEKPDLLAYTHFQGSEAYGPGSPDSGTSAACPVAAGCVAALRTVIAPSITPSGNMFAQLRATARALPRSPAGWNADHGYGIINPLAAAHSLGVP